MPDQPSNGVEVVEEPGVVAPEADLRAARDEIRGVAAGLRTALAADDLLVAGERQATEGER